MKKQLLLTRMLLLVALLVGSVSNAWGDSYTITFGNNANSATGISSTTNATTVISSGTNYVTTQPFTINSGNCYYGDTKTCIRLGKSSSSASLSIALSETGKVKATSIVVNCKLYNSSDPSTLTVNSLTGQSVPSSVGNLTFNFASATDIENITLAVTKKIYVYSITVNYTAAPAYTITAQSNNNSYGTVSLSGSVITANPADGYRVSTSTPYTVSPANSATVSQNGNEFTVTPSDNTTVTINFEAIPTHDVTWNVNGATTVVPYEEGADIDFSGSPASIGGKVFVGWSAAPIDGTTDVAPSYVKEATMSTSDLTYYAVFANEIADEEDASLTINKDTENFPGIYGTANTFTEYTLEGTKFKIQQAYVNGTKLQWRASGHDNGTGTMYNTDALNKIQSIVLTYDASDSNKNFTINIGNAENPTSGTAITPSSDNNVYTFDCSGENVDYFVMTNGSGAGYLSSITINYKKETIGYSAYCTSITVPVEVSALGYATFASDKALDFTDKSIKAYKATVTGTTVNFTQVNVVPANTGVLLYAASGASIDVPVATAAAATAAADDFAGNKLVRGTGDALTYAAGTAEYYILSKEGNKVGFYKANNNTVATNRAYLDLTGTNAKSFTMPGGETDGIRSIENGKLRIENSNYYNLAGQRVGKDYKGIVIVNGKKMLNK